MHLNTLALAPALALALAPRLAAGQPTDPASSAADAPDAAESAEPAPAPAEPAEPLASTHSTHSAESLTAEASAEPAPRRFAASIGLNQDAFFGFYPTAAGSYQLTRRLSFAFYGILWTTPSFSYNAGGGGLWTEFGAGVELSLLDEALAIRPQLGVLNGTLLSGSDKPLAAEGVVPNLTVHFANRYAEGEFYGGYYLAVRGARQNDFIHYWANAGLRPLGFTRSAWPDLITVGAHWEHLRLQRTVGGDPTDIYKWIGGFAQFALPAQFALRFTAGGDLGGPERGEFYKAAVVKSF